MLTQPRVSRFPHPNEAPAAAQVGSKTTTLQHWRVRGEYSLIFRTARPYTRSFAKRGFRVSHREGAKMRCFSARVLVALSFCLACGSTPVFAIDGTTENTESLQAKQQASANNAVLT